MRLVACSWVSVLLFLLLMCCRLLKTDSHTYVDPKYVSTFLANLVKSGYFSQMFSCVQKSTEPASCSCASRSHSCSWIHPIETSLTFATCCFQAPCGSAARGLLTRSITAAMSWNCENRLWNSFAIRLMKSAYLCSVAGSKSSHSEMKCFKVWK